MLKEINVALKYSVNVSETSVVSGLYYNEICHNRSVVFYFYFVQRFYKEEPHSKKSMSRSLVSSFLYSNDSEIQIFVILLYI